MNISDTPLEKICKDLLQTNLTFDFNNKIFKRGKLIIFHQKNFFINFILETEKNSQEKLEIPIPFGLEYYKEDGLVYFDYRLKTLTKHTPEIENYLKVYGINTSTNKFWDSIMCVSAVPPESINRLTS